MNNNDHQLEFTIGQMARLHQIPVKTLRYYDEINLFKPFRVDAHTGYRYYIADQFELLNTIVYLRTLGIPIKEIQHHLQTRDLNAFLNLLQTQLATTENRIAELQRTAARFRTRIQAITDARAVRTNNTPQLIQREAENIVLLRDQIHTNAEIELALRELTRGGAADNIFIGNVGLTLSREDLLAGRYDTFNSVFMTTTDAGTATLPAGQYVQITYNGNHQDNAPAYTTAMTFIAAHHLSVSGDAIERTIIDHYISAKRTDYLTELLIPVN
jgi:DNA-binding transcriptional MerR regulator